MSAAVGERPFEGTWEPLVVYVRGERISFEGRYEASHRGLVWSLPGPGRGRSSSIGHLLALCPQVGPRNVAHYAVSLYGDGGLQRCFLGRIILATFAGPPGPDQECCHGPGGSLDDRWPENLRWDTRTENNRDLVRHGTHYLTRRTHCPQLHELVMPNLVASTLALGWRNCLACARARSAVRHARRAGGPVPDMQTISDLKYAAIMATARLD